MPSGSLPPAEEVPIYRGRTDTPEIGDPDYAIANQERNMIKQFKAQIGYLMAQKRQRTMYITRCQIVKASHGGGGLYVREELADTGRPVQKSGRRSHSDVPSRWRPLPLVPWGRE